MISYTWKNEWTFKHESSHSLLQKFLYLNSITATQFRKLLKEDNGQLGDYIKNLGIHSDDITLLLSSQRTKEELKICPKCILHGYHSNYHNDFSHCFIHGDLLFSSCKRCSKVFHLNRLSEKYYTSPYNCICGFSMCNDRDILSNLINQNKNRSVKNELILRFTISLDDSIEHMDLNITEEHLVEVFETTTAVIDNTLTKISREDIDHQMYYYSSYPESKIKKSSSSDLNAEKERLSLFIHETKDFFIKENYSEINRYNYTIPLMLKVIKMRQLGSRILQINLGVYKSLSDHQSLILPFFFETCSLQYPYWRGRNEKY
jgi:hypothetical protein